MSHSDHMFLIEEINGSDWAEADSAEGAWVAYRTIGSESTHPNPRLRIINQVTKEIVWEDR
jgi:hypothetical protein